MKTLKLFVVAAIAFASAATAFGQKPEILLSTLADASGATEGNLNDASGVTVLEKQNIYILDKKIYVPDGHTLIIEPGTIIKAYGEAEGKTLADLVALVVTRGGKIQAVGTPQEPIVFTTVLDPIQDVTKGSTYSILNKEKWGGVVILGKAYNTVEYGEIIPEAGTLVLGERHGLGYIEGLNQPDSRHWYGAESWDDPNNTPSDFTDDIPVFVNDDNSGVMKYVSIRHGGMEIETDNEVNGLSLGSVGSGTTLENIEIVSNGDDGIEFFGGTVNLKYANVLFCEDDGLDWDQGYHGKIQFAFVCQLPTTTGDETVKYGDHGMEMDGDDGARTGYAWQVPLVSDPTVYNVTALGANDGDAGLELKERTGGQIANSIFMQFSEALNVNTTYPGTLELHNNLFVNNGPALMDATEQAEFDANGNLIDPTAAVGILDDIYVVNVTGTGATQRTNVTDAFDMVPPIGNTVIEDEYAVPADGFFDYAPYRGAFAPGSVPWTETWSKMEDVGADNNTFDCPTDNTGDNITNADDLNAVIGQWGKSCNR